MTSPARLRRMLATAALGAALGPAALLAVFTAGATIRLPFDTDPPRSISGIFPVERDAASGLTFAWTGRDMTVRLPNLDRSRDWTLALRARAGRPAPAPNPGVSFYADGILLSTQPATADFSTLRVTLPARPQRARGALVRIEVSSTMVPGPGDSRALGLMVDDLTIAPDGRASPPPDVIVRAAIGAGLFGAAIGMLAGGFAAAAAVLAAAIGQAALLARGLGPYTDYASTAALVAAWTALALVLSAALARRRAVPPSCAARTVLIFSAIAFFLKLLALLHPEMPIGDAMFHAHRFQGVLAGHLYFTSIAPGNYTFPYPPGFYLVAAPFARFVMRGPADMALLRTVALAVDTVAGASLYLAVRRNWPRLAWTAAAAVVLYQLVPLDFRVITTGNLTNAFAQSVAVLALTTIATIGSPRVLGRHTALLTATMAVAFMSHTSTFPLLFTAGLATAGLLYWKGQADGRRLAGVVLVATIAAFVLAVVVYYAHFGDTYRAEWTRISTETAAAAPDAGGRSIAARAASVPMYLRTYFGLVPLALSLLGGWSLFRAGRRDPLTLALGGWTLACLAFLALGILTPVDMRYYLAAVVVIAVAGAEGMDFLGYRVSKVIGWL